MMIKTMIYLTLLSLCIASVPCTRLAMADGRIDKQNNLKYSIVDLGPPDALRAVANGINDAGQVAGWCQTPPDTMRMRAFVWQGGKMTELNPVEGDVFSEANAINSKGQLAGASFASLD